MRYRRGVRRIWTHVVAVFVVFHVAASCADVIPDVSMGMNRRRWSEPRVERELQAWAERLGMPLPVFEDRLYQAARLLLHTRRAISSPFRPYLALTGQHQSWAMFVAGTTTSDTFEVRARACPVRDDACDWELLYRRGDPAHGFMKTVLEASRIRSAVFKWGWPLDRTAYTRGCTAVARRAFAARPALAVVQCRFARVASPPGHAPPGWTAPPPSYGREVTVLRDALPPVTP